MGMRIRLALLAACSIATASVGGVLAGTEAAAVVYPVPSTVGNNSCDAGEICMWEHDDYQGCFKDLVPPNADSDYENGTPAWNNCSGGMGDMISSYQNRSSSFMSWWEGDFSGAKFCAAPGAASPNLKNFGNPYTPEDRFSSHETTESGAAGCHWDDTD